MIQNLDELTQYIRQTLPQSKAILNLRAEEKSDVVRFTWNSREFVVKKSLEVLEVRGRNVYITGASMLLQTVLMKRDRNEKILEAVVATLSEVEGMVRTNSERGLALLGTVKQTLGKLAGKPMTPALTRRC
jgi:hypothetical protein